VEDRDLARSFAFGRIGLGAALLVVPRLVGALWIGADAAGGRGARVLLRAVGARDLALGLGLKASLDRDAPTRGWLEGGLVADSVDLAATVTASRALPLSGRLLVAVLAGSGVALGAKLLRSAEAGPAATPPEQRPARAGAASLASP
jgi:hypothetical protein